jgi:phage baseplate assembly protein W
MATPFRVDRYTATSKQSEVYSDFLDDFNTHPDTGDLVRNTNEAAVSRSIRNLIQTNKYDAPFDPTKGGNVGALLFENMTPQTAAQLQESITTVIKNREPRAKLVSVLIDTYPEQKAFLATITFYIVTSSNPVVLKHVLKRVR